MWERIPKTSTSAVACLSQNIASLKLIGMYSLYSVTRGTRSNRPGQSVLSHCRNKIKEARGSR